MAKGSSNSSSSSSKSESSKSTSSLGAALGGFASALGNALGALGAGLNAGAREGGSKSASKSDSGSSSSRAGSDYGRVAGESAASIGKSSASKEDAKSKNAKAAADSKAAATKGYKGNAAEIAGELKSAGWTDTQIAGALGRLQQESSLNPAAMRKNDAGPGLHSKGIAQHNRDRLSNLESYSKALGLNPGSVKAQASFINHEMFGNKDQRVAGKFGSKSEAFAASQMAKAATVEDAARAMMHYERPKGYKRSNPTAGHGWNNTLNNANAFAQGRGLNVSTPSATAGFRDPAVKVVNYSQPATATATATAEQKDRLGLAKLTGALEKGDIKTAARTAWGALNDPLGFALDTVEDTWNNRGSNTFGLDGVTSAMAPGAPMTGSGGDSGANNKIKIPEQVAAVKAEEPKVQQPVYVPFGWSKLSGRV